MRSGAEGTAATARALRLRVLDRKPGALQAVDVIDFRAVQHGSALRIHDDFHVAFFNYRVVVIHFGFKGHPVLLAAAPAALDVDPQSDNVLFLIVDQLFDFFFGNWGDRNHESLRSNMS